ncbi:MAG: hypothetical protein DCC71_15465 [Proteobacteria bacterium]|nr:MAG: hypothetical protein DCC71_15465 [Pseudomonadota bacterium]
MGAQLELVENAAPAPPSLVGPLGFRAARRLVERLERLDLLIARSLEREVRKRETRDQRATADPCLDGRPDQRSARWVPFWSRRVREERAYRRRLEAERAVLTLRLRRPDSAATLALAPLSNAELKRAALHARRGGIAGLGELVAEALEARGLVRMVVDDLNACGLAAGADAAFAAGSRPASC